MPMIIIISNSFLILIRKIIIDKSGVDGVLSWVQVKIGLTWESNHNTKRRGNVVVLLLCPAEWNENQRENYYCKILYVPYSAVTHNNTIKLFSGIQCRRRSSGL